MQTTTEINQSLSQRSVGSAINVGGDVDIDATQDVVLRGSEVNAQGNIDVEAENIRLLAAQNIEREFTSVETVNIGVYASAEASGEASADAGVGTSTSFDTDAGAEVDTFAASASASAEAAASANADAGARASGSASSTVDFARVQKNTEERLDITNTASAFNSGGNMRLNAADTIELVGSELIAEGDVDIAATDIIARAAEDISTVTTTNETTRVGIYADAGGSASADAGASAEASASAEAQAGVGTADLTGDVATAEAKAGATAKAGVAAEAEGKASIGLQAKNARAENSTTQISAVTSLIRSNSGSVSRTAENRIVDEGTQIAAAQDFTQSARQIDSFAARNETITTSSYDEVTARTGLYAEAEGEASADAGATANASVTAEGDPKAKGEVGAQAKAEGGARVGVETMIDTLSERTRNRVTEAVVSNITVGGNVSSTSTEASTFEGTEISAGGDLDVNAQELNITAARNTNDTESSSLSTSTRVAVAVGVGGSAEAGAKADTDGKSEAGADAEGGVKVRAELEFNLQTENETSRETEAVTASFSGGNVNLNSDTDINIEGADIAADDSINITAENLNFEAAQNTSESSSSSTEVDVEVLVEATIIGSVGAEAEGEVGVDVASASESGTEAVVGSLSSSNLNVTTTGDANFEGTQVEATDSANLDIGGALNVTAAQSTTRTQADSTSVAVAASGNSDGEVEAEVNVAVAGDSSSSSQATVASFNVGNLNITTGDDANFEGTEVNATGLATLDVGGDLNVTAARNTAQSQSNSVEVDVSVEVGDSFEAGVGVGVSESSEQSSEALAGSFNVGGLDITTGGDANFEGTTIESEGDASLAVGGDLNITAARSTESSRSLDVGVEVGVSDSGGNVGVDVGVGRSDSNQAAAGSLASGGSLSITTGGDATFEGTDIAGDDGVDLIAGGDVAFNEALSTSSSLDVSVGVGVGGSSESKENKETGETTTTNKQNAEFNVGLDISDSRTGEGSNVSGGSGGINIQSGGDVSLQGTEFDSPADIDAEGEITESELTDEGFEFGIEVGASFENESKTTTATEKSDSEESEAPSSTQASSESELASTSETESSDSQQDQDDAGDTTRAASSDSDEEDSDTQASADQKTESKEDGDKTADEEKENAGAPKIAFLDKKEKPAADKPESETAEPEPAPEPRAPETLELQGSSVAVPGLVDVSPDQIQLTDSDGNAVPDWVSVNLETGEIEVDMPEGFEGTLNINLALPDGQTFEVEVNN